MRAFDRLGFHIWRLLAFAFGIFAAFSLVLGLASTRNADPVPALLMFAMPAALSWFFWRKAKSELGGRVERIDPSASEAQARQVVAFMDAVNTTRSFPRPAPRLLLDDPARPLLATTEARQVEIVTQTVRDHVGTRINLGSVPIYLGRSSPVTRQSLKHSMVGELGITPTHLLFAAQGKSADIRLDRITSVELYTDGFAVSATGRQKPVVFQVGNPILWSQLVKNVRLLGLSDRTLPPSKNQIGRAHV